MELDVWLWEPCEGIHINFSVYLKHWLLILQFRVPCLETYAVADILLLRTPRLLPSSSSSSAVIDTLLRHHLHHRLSISTSLSSTMMAA